ncbi:MAG TPA: BTAD domain-containing putative transcriptional regulator [Anaerolineaceae bacterium]
MFSNHDRLPITTPGASIPAPGDAIDTQARLKAAAEAVAAARQGQPAQLAEALADYGRLLNREGENVSACAAAREALQVDPHSRGAVEAHITLGTCAAQANRLEDAEQEYNHAAELSRKIHYPLGLADAQQHLANHVLLVRGQFHLAMTMIDEARILREEQGSQSWIEPFLRAFIYEILGDRRHCRQVLDDLLPRVQPGTRLAAAYYFLWGRLAMDEEELEQADEYLRLGLRVANQMHILDLNLWIRLEYSRYYRVIREAPIARNWAENVLHQAQQTGSQYFSGLALIERAQGYWDVGNASAAEADLDEAARALEPLDAAFELARVRYLRALWYRLSGKPEAEATWLEAARAIIQDGYAFLLEKEQDAAFPLIAAHMRGKSPATRAITEEVLRYLSNVPPPPLRVASLGQFAVWKGRRRIADAAWSKRKAGELFRYLLLQTNRAAGREVIIEALWPDSLSENPGDLLHQSTSALRHALEPDLPDKFPSRYLKVEGERIALDLPPGSSVDFEQFERNLPLAIQAESIDRLLEGLNLYAGELFPSDRYADWSAEKRQSLSELRQRGTLVLAQSYLEQGQYFNALNCCRQVLSSDGWNEDATLLAMHAYVGIRDIPHAIAAYMDLERRLKQELDTIPRSDLRQMVEQLRRR